MRFTFPKYRNLFLIVLAGLGCAVALAAPMAGGGGLWLSAGQGNHNNRNAATETRISAANASDLAVKWVFATGGDVTATPAVDGTNVYVPAWDGKLYSLDRQTGAENWSVSIGTYNGLSALVPGPFGPSFGGGQSRATPAVYGDALILGDQGGREFAGTTVMSVNKHSGALNWISQIEEHPAALATTSPVVHGDTVYIGVASNDEGFAAFVPGYPCCSARGSVVALNADTGAILWKTYMSPAAPPTYPADIGFSGNGVWGSTPVVDTKRGSVYVTTGNNYSAPASVLDCITALGANPDSDDVATCVDPTGADGNYFDSVVALDWQTGEVKWATKALPFDAWTVACIVPFINPGNCPAPAGPDYDFGQGPALFTVKGDNGPPRDLLGAGQKSGQYWSLNPDDGSVVWVTQAGPGGVTGGLQWGSATDGERIYTANTQTGWYALDAATGAILWDTPNPGGGDTFGAVTLANGVLYGGSTDPGALNNTMYALDAANGDILFDFASGGSVGSGAAVVNGTVYWGSGYQVIGGPPVFAGNNKLYAFGVP